MSKFQLKVEDDYDFFLVGISCHHKDYRLCYELNKTFELDLVKDNDLVITKNEDRANFSLSLFVDEENHREYYLLSNKGVNGFLVPEQRAADFFLMIRGGIDERELEHMVNNLRQLEITLAAFEIQPNSLKSKANLLF